MPVAANEPNSFKRPESVLVVVYTQSGQTLLLNRVPPCSFWQSVTGSLKWNQETSLQAAQRELQEETGINASLDQIRNWNRNFKFTIFPEYRHRYSAGVTENTEYVFSLQLPEAVRVEIQPVEHTDYCWVDLDEAVEMVWSWTNREALQWIKEEF